MVTNPEEVEAPDRPKVILNKVEEVTRTVIAGSPVGAIRRIVLYALVLIALVLSGGNMLAVGFGLVALFVLAMTDRLA